MTVETKIIRNSDNSAHLVVDGGDSDGFVLAVATRDFRGHWRAFPKTAGRTKATRKKYETPEDALAVFKPKARQ